MVSESTLDLPFLPTATAQALLTFTLQYHTITCRKHLCILIKKFTVPNTKGTITKIAYE